MPKKLYYSIRVLEADTYTEAVQAVEDGYFIDTDEMSDIIITKPDLIKLLTEPTWERCNSCGSEIGVQGNCLC